MSATQTPQILQMIDAWFEEAERACTVASPTDDRYAASLSAVLLATVHTYSHAAALLLDNGLRLPAMVLLRTVAEAYVKFLWCTDSNDNNETQTRHRKWQKSSCKDWIKTLDDLINRSHLSGAQADRQLKDYRDAISEYQRLNLGTIKCMPPVTGTGGLFEQLPKGSITDLFAIIYGSSCAAVHIDTMVQSKLVTRKPGCMEITSDLPDDPSWKSCCLALAHEFLLAVYKTLGLDTLLLCERYAQAMSLFPKEAC